MGRPKLISDEALLATAREVFIEHGIGASTREIARRAGCSEAVLYQRFPTKPELFFAAMVPPAIDMEELLAKVDDEADGLEQLERIAHALMVYFRKMVPVLVPLMTHPSFDFELFAERHVDTPIARLRLGLVKHLEGMRARGLIQTEHVGSIALTLFGTLHSLAIFERLGVHGGKFKAPVVRDVVRALWSGLEPKPRRSPRRS